MGLLPRGAHRRCACIPDQRSCGAAVSRMRTSRKSGIARLVRTSEPRPHAQAIFAVQAEKIGSHPQTPAAKEYENERTHIVLADSRVLSRRIPSRDTTAGPSRVNSHVPCRFWRRSAEYGGPKYVGVEQYRS